MMESFYLFLRFDFISCVYFLLLSVTFYHEYNPTKDRIQNAAYTFWNKIKTTDFWNFQILDLNGYNKIIKHWQNMYCMILEKSE